MKPRIHTIMNIKCCKKANISYLLHFQPCFFILKALKDIQQHFKFVNWQICGFVFLTSQAVSKLLQNSTKYHYRALHVFGEKLFAPVLSKKAHRRLRALSLFSDRIICSKVLSFTSLTAGYIDLQNPKILQTNRQLDKVPTGRNKST